MGSVWAQLSVSRAVAQRAVAQRYSTGLEGRRLLDEYENDGDERMSRARSME